MHSIGIDLFLGEEKTNVSYNLNTLKIISTKKCRTSERTLFALGALLSIFSLLKKYYQKYPISMLSQLRLLEQNTIDYVA